MEARCLARSIRANASLSSSLFRSQPVHAQFRQGISQRTISSSSTSQKPAGAAAAAAAEPFHQEAQPQPRYQPQRAPPRFSSESLFSMSNSRFSRGNASQRSHAEKLNDVSNALDRIFENSPDRHTAHSIFSNEYSNTPRNPSAVPDSSTLARSVRRSAALPAMRPKPKVDLRLTPSLGRTVPVDPKIGVDLNQAFRSLEATCARNGVRRDMNAQRFHTRKGQVRKDLRSRRWRKLFKFSFQNTLARCQRLRNQGW